MKYFFILFVLIFSLSCSHSFHKDRLYRSEVFLGLQSPKGPVTPQQWSHYLKTELLPKVPGLTVLDAKGFWVNSKNKMESENSKVLILIHKGDPETLQKIKKALLKYKEMFEQEAVLSLIHPVKLQ